MGVREIIVAMTIAKSVRCTRRRVQVVETKPRYHSNHEMEGQCTVAIVSGLSVLTLAEIVDLAGSRLRQRAKKTGVVILLIFFALCLGIRFERKLASTDKRHDLKLTAFLQA